MLDVSLQWAAPSVVKAAPGPDVEERTTTHTEADGHEV
jgi:hypothetical protein